ncbi:P-loop NTPase fold protein, partial [Klebsiella pneumoniae]|uniref:P-loop NTPase fold protein n=1 Tax=Klebsiella pneumoniae TaxID=573 RepID=UPI003855E33B
MFKGEWGVGKTHFWNHYYEDEIKKGEIDRLAYSYVSLFGLNSIGEIKKKLFSSAIPLSQKLYREDLLEKKQQMIERFFSGVYNRVRYHKLCKKIFNNFSMGISGFGLKSSEFTIFDGYNYVNKYLICFDDLERKGSSLEIKDFMGLVDDLARSKACKIILIYNENNLTKNEEAKQFIEYREKIVDRDIMYKPDVI